jgi:hypothetical protein
MGALIHGDWKMIVGEQEYSDYRGPLFPCARCAFFDQRFTLEDAIEFHAFALLEALACV